MFNKERMENAIAERNSLKQEIQKAQYDLRELEVGVAKELISDGGENYLTVNWSRLNSDLNRKVIR